VVFAWDWSDYASLIAEITDLPAYLLRWGLTSFFPRPALNRDPPNLCLLSDIHEPLHPARI
jgi:hypothetical protein